MLKNHELKFLKKDICFCQYLHSFFFLSFINARAEENNERKNILTNIKQLYSRCAWIACI